MPDKKRQPTPANLTEIPDFSAGAASVKKTATAEVVEPKPAPKAKKEVRRPLKPRDIKFIEAKTKDPDTPNYKAAMAATGTDNMRVANVQAQRMLQNVSLREALDESMAKLGITIDDAIAPVKEAMDYESENERDQIEVRLKGHDRAVKLLTIIGGEDKGGGGNSFTFIGNNMFVKKGDT